MKKLLLASTSTVYGGTYLSYLQDELINFFEGINQIIFIPYARPSGIRHDEYTAIAHKEKRLQGSTPLQIQQKPYVMPKLSLQAVAIHFY